MPITPHFQLSQTLTHVTVDIHVPHVRVSVESVEVVVDGATLHFSSPPYLLLLTFPGVLQEESSDSAKYDPTRDGGTVMVELKKQEPVLWKDLDMLGKLLQKKKGRDKPLGVEIISEERIVDGGAEDEENVDTPNALDEGKPRYGFLNMFVGVFTDLVREGLASEMLQLPCPDETETANRRQLRLDAEEEAFDADRYLGDFDVQDDYLYQCAMGMEPHWRRTSSVESLTMCSNSTTLSFFTEEERAKLASISYPILPSLIEEKQQQSLLLGLLDILFAYVYDHLLTDGDPTIESSWTVCSLSCTLSWLESEDSNIANVIRFSIRRSLVYPYIRNYDFAQYCWDQVADIMGNGRRCILRCLLQVRSILDKSEVHYLGNRLYIDPYLGWIQSQLSDEALRQFSETLTKEGCWAEKEVLGLQLGNIESLLDGDNTSEEESDEESDDSGDSDSDDSADGADTDTRKQVVVSSELVDSEIQNFGMLRISTSDGEEHDAKESATTPPKKPLIEELS